MQKQADTEMFRSNGQTEMEFETVFRTCQRGKEQQI